MFKPHYKDGILELSYKGLDSLKRSTRMKFVRTPDTVTGGNITYDICLEPRATESIFITTICTYNNSEKKAKDFKSTLLRIRKGIKEKKKDCTDIYTSNEQFNETIKRSLSDINMMLTKTESGFYPYGGIPWYCTPFGRDGIITLLECLWINPLIAQGVLRYLASFQAEDTNRETLAEPGKILHEIRGGEMAALKEIPFGLALYRYKEHFLKVFSGIFDTSLFMEFQRLPELFCGFHKRNGTPPTLYPIACSPQTWASGSLLFMLQASSGIYFKADEQKIIFDNPVLPKFLNYIYLKNLIVTRDKSVDLLIKRYDEDVTIEVQRKTADITVEIIK